LLPAKDPVRLMQFAREASSLIIIIAHFKRKYNTPNPTILIEDKVEEVFGGSWMFKDGNPACMLYAMRIAMEGIPSDDEVWYGKINGLGELVHFSELEEVKNK